MPEPIRIETEDHHIVVMPKDKPEPEQKSTPFLSLFVGLVLIAIALNLWHVQHRSAIQVHQPVVQGSGE